MTLFFRSRFLRIVLGILTVLFSRISHARQAVECSYPGHPESHFIVSTQNASEYMDHGYSCQLIEVQDSYSVSSNKDVNKSQEKKSTHVVGKNSRLELSYQECVDKIRTSTGPMSQEVIRCYRRVAPEVFNGKPLTPEHASLLSLQLSSDTVSFEEAASARALVTSSSENSNSVSSQIAKVKTCIQVQENASKAVQSSKSETLQELKDLIYRYKPKFAAVDQPERERISDQLNQQIISLIGAAAKENRCWFGAPRSILGQNPSPAEKTQARLSVKGTGMFDLIDVVLGKAQEVTEQRRNAHGAK